MAPAPSGCWSSHDPTANTVTGTPSRPAAASSSCSSPGSPDPWNVNATCFDSVGPWARNTAGPLGADPSVGADGPSAGAVGRAARRDPVQAPTTAAEAAPRK